jgi:Do/DeqQ family serine protease
MKRTALVLWFVLFAVGCHNRPSSSGSEPRSMPGGSAAVTGPLLSYADVVDRVAPAVVTIQSSQRVRAPQQFPFSDDPFFRQFFGGTIPRGGGTQVEESLGSGVIVRADGYILTNHHVIDGADQIKVDLIGSRRTYSAKVVGSDPPSDLAVLKISASDLPVLQPGDSDNVRVGDVCLAVGNPLGVGETVTSGIISAKGRATGSGNGSFQDFLQTDAPINKGNSGGALVNTRGELIGINSQILSPTGGSIGIGFAIPSNMAKTVMNQLIGKGKVQRGMIGVTVQRVTSDLAPGFGLKEARGIAISGVTAGGAGDKAGLKQGDVVLQLNGKDVSDTNEFRNQIAGMAPGTEVTLTIWRDSAQQQVRVRLGEWGGEAAAEPEQGGGGEAGGRLGINAEPLTPETAAQLGLRRGTQGLVVTQVDPAGPAAQAGVRTGDVIQEVNRQPVRTLAEVRDALRKSGNRAAVLLVNRGGQTIYVPVPQQ